MVIGEMASTPRVRDGAQFGSRSVMSFSLAVQMLFRGAARFTPRLSAILRILQRSSCFSIEMNVPFTEAAVPSQTLMLVWPVVPSSALE